MAIAAFEVDERAARAAADGFHVDRVVQLDCGSIAWRDAGDGAKFREFGMSILETMDLRIVLRMGMAVFQISVATSTGLVVGRGEVGGGTVLGVAGRTIGGRDLRRVMSRAIVACETGAVSSFR